MENETPSRRKISPVEVIAILGPILFVVIVLWPVMSSVPSVPRESKCMSNLQQLSKAMKMYKLDYKDYPETLCGHVRIKDGKTVDSEDVLNRSASYGNTSSVYPEYIRSIEGFHCPYSPVRRTDSIVELKKDGKTVKYYAFDSYDVYTPRRFKGVLRLGPDALRYSKPAKGASDDTVVTWCSYHNESRNAKNGVIILWLDGSTRALPAADVEGADGKSGTRWKTKPVRL